MEKIGQARQDSEIAAMTFNDAKYIRKQMQINNEEMYFIYTYVVIFSKDKKELLQKVDKVEGILKGGGLIPKKAYFRQEQAFLSSLPFMENNRDIKESAKRNILTDSIEITYPFISSTIQDENGILIGTNLYNNSLIFIDKFDKEKYKNSNMCIFGASGSGKSYFTKLIILRLALQGITQYIIDPDREYESICKELEGTIIKIGPSSNTFINIFDIRKESLEDSQNGYLETKLNKLKAFFNMIFSDLDDNEKSILEQKIILTYKQKGITFEDKTLFKNKKFKETHDMPIMKDLYNNLDEKMKVKLLPFVNGSMKFLNNYTNVKLDNNIIIGDIYELEEENLKYGMFIFIELFWDKIKQNRNIKKCIYLDEIWKLIGVTSNKDVASFIYKIFKTIRKYGGSATSITQDVSDIFSLDNGITRKIFKFK